MVPMVPMVHRSQRGVRDEEVVLAESSPNAGDGCDLLSDGMYVVAVYVEDTSGTSACRTGWTGVVFGDGWRF